MSDSTNRQAAGPHVALLTSSGVSHLTLFLRLATSLLRHNCQLTLITCHPILSLAESKLISDFLSAFPQVEEHQLHLLPPDVHHHHSSNNNDPFLLQWHSARRSLHLLPPLLSSLSAFPSALVFDVTLVSPLVAVAQSLNLPVYVLFPSCARMLSLLAYYPVVSSSSGLSLNDVIEIPGLKPIPLSSIPPLLLNPNSIFASIFKEDGEKITKVDGIFINTFEKLEAHNLDALESGKVRDGLPPVFPIVVTPCEFERESDNAVMKWLDDQPVKSVVYVSFGSKTAMSRELIKEMGRGLIGSGFPFLWVVKYKEVDKEDEESLTDILGEELIEKVKGKGMVVKEWVNQGEILGHRAVGGFLSHCGWGSVVESAWNGIPMLTWPPKGDQRVSAEVAEMGGLGIWPRNWGWAAETVVKGEEIAEKIKQLMESEELRWKAEEIKEAARKAVGEGGSCERLLKQVIDKWNTTYIPGFQSQILITNNLKVK